MLVIYYKGRCSSPSFPGIGCAGEIRVSTHEDYDKWAIDILVKFRDEEKLQLLTGQRQSGGVRSFPPLRSLTGTNDQVGTVVDDYLILDESNGTGARAILSCRRDQPGDGPAGGAFGAQQHGPSDLPG